MIIKKTFIALLKESLKPLIVSYVTLAEITMLSSLPAIYLFVYLKMNFFTEVMLAFIYSLICCSFYVFYKVIIHSLKTKFIKNRTNLLLEETYRWYREFIRTNAKNDYEKYINSSNTLIQYNHRNIDMLKFQLKTIINNKTVNFIFPTTKAFWNTLKINMYRLMIIAFGAALFLFNIINISDIPKDNIVIYVIILFLYWCLENYKNGEKDSNECNATEVERRINMCHDLLDRIELWEKSPQIIILQDKLERLN